MWRRDGKELFYVAPDQKLMAVSVSGDASFPAGKPTPLFQLRLILYPPVDPRLQYAVAARGDRFLVNMIVEPTMRFKHDPHRSPVSTACEQCGIASEDARGISANPHWL
jgi:hypothetical protein